MTIDKHQLMPLKKERTMLRIGFPFALSHGREG